MYQYSVQSRWCGKMFHLHVPATEISIQLLWLQSREHAAHNSNNISCSNVNNAIWLELIAYASTRRAMGSGRGHGGQCPWFQCYRKKIVKIQFHQKKWKWRGTWIKTMVKERISWSFFLSRCYTTTHNHNTCRATQKTDQHHDLLHPPASSGFNFLGECNCSALCNQSWSAQHGDAFLLCETNEFFILFNIIL